MGSRSDSRRLRRPDRTHPSGGARHTSAARHDSRSNAAPSSGAALAPAVDPRTAASSGASPRNTRPRGFPRRRDTRTGSRTERRGPGFDHGALGTATAARGDRSGHRHGAGHPADPPRARQDAGRHRVDHRGGARHRRVARRQLTWQRRSGTARRLRPHVRRHRHLGRTVRQRAGRPGPAQRVGG